MRNLIRGIPNGLKRDNAFCFHIGSMRNTKQINGIIDFSKCYTIDMNIIPPNELNAFIFYTIKEPFILSSFSPPMVWNIVLYGGILINGNSMRGIAFDDRLGAMHPIVASYLCIDGHA